MSSISLEEYSDEKKRHSLSSFVLFHLPIVNKDELFHHLAAVMSTPTHCAPEDILRCLYAREEEQNTGVGHGVAMPHGFLPSLNSSFAFLCLLKRPIDYGAMDDEKVDLIYAVLSPLQSGAGHLKILSRCARSLSSAPLRSQMRGAHSQEALASLVEELILGETTDRSTLL